MLILATGYKVRGVELFTGDILAKNQGYGGYFKIEPRFDEFWIVDCSAEVWGWGPDEQNEDETVEPFRLDKDLGIHWEKRDKNNPTKTPPDEIACKCCDAIVGSYDTDENETTWFENCAYHEELQEGYLNAWCHTCYPVRATKEKRAPKLTEIEEYFFRQYEKASFRVVPGHWPTFKSKEEVDRWLGLLDVNMAKAFDAAFSEED